MPTLLKNFVSEGLYSILDWTTYSKKCLKAKDVLHWSLKLPAYSAFRVNTLLFRVEDVVDHIRNEYKSKYGFTDMRMPPIYVHKVVPECIVVERVDRKYLNLDQRNHRVIVDGLCAAAILNGSQLFAPGILDMNSDIEIGSKVSVYVQLVKLKREEDTSPFDNIFVGNGIATMDWNQIFKGKVDAVKGIAVRMTDPISGIMPFDWTPRMGNVQSVPAILAVKCLSPNSGERILCINSEIDGQIKHIANLMNDSGSVIGLRNHDKNVTEELFHIRTFRWNFLKNGAPLVTRRRGKNEKPPFEACSFDRVLVNGPDSGLGKRPNLRNNQMFPVNASHYIKLQTTILVDAMLLLKAGGTLVFCTNSILCEENECIVSWILRYFPNMELVPAEPRLGAPGLPNCGLNDEQLKLVQRFGPGVQADDDSTGYFIAKFVKLK